MMAAFYTSGGAEWDRPALAAGFPAGPSAGVSWDHHVSGSAPTGESPGTSNPMTASEMPAEVDTVPGWGQSREYGGE